LFRNLTVAAISINIKFECCKLLQNILATCTHVENSSQNFAAQRKPWSLRPKEKPVLLVARDGMEEIFLKILFLADHT